MWLFTHFGFFSIVQKDGEAELTIRSRTRGDLLRLQRNYLPQLSAPICHEGTDYPWRARCSHQALAEAMPRIVRQIQYVNFKDEVAASLGPERAHRYAKIWGALHGMDDDLPEPVREGWEGLPWPKAGKGGKAPAFGGVVIDPTGRILLREVAGHYDGYVWSFAKGRPQKGEAPRVAALREVAEEVGVAARIPLPLARTFEGGTTRNHYFLMLVDPETVDLGFRCRETSGLRWALPEEARRMIGETGNAVGRARDLAVLDAALGALPAPLPLRRRVARSEDWETRPLPARRAQLPFEKTCSASEMARIVRGFIPSAMEEEWFAWFEDGVLHLHRSWTGFEIFRVHWLPMAEGAWKVSLVEVNRHADQYKGDDGEADLLHELIDNLLIGWEQRTHGRSDGGSTATSDPTQLPGQSGCG